MVSLCSLLSLLILLLHELLEFLGGEVPEVIDGLIPRCEFVRNIDSVVLKGPLDVSTSNIIMEPAIPQFLIDLLLQGEE